MVTVGELNRDRIASPQPTLLISLNPDRLRVVFWTYWRNFPPSGGVASLSLPSSSVWDAFFLLKGISRPRERGRKPIHRVAYPCDLSGDYSAWNRKRESGGNHPTQAIFITWCEPLGSIRPSQGRKKTPPCAFFVSFLQCARLDDLLAPPK